MKISETTFFYKRLITRATNGGPGNKYCLGGGGGYIYVHSIYQPVTIRWDKTPFLDSVCYRGAFINDNIEWELTQVSLDNFPGITYCMADTSEATLELTAEAFALDPSLSRLDLEYEVEGLGTQTIYGFPLAIGPVFGFTPCYWITDITTLSLENEATLYPNPCQDWLAIRIPPGRQLQALQLYDQQGTLLAQQPFDNGQNLMMASYPAGVYHLFGELADGRMAYLGQIIKQ